MNYLRDILNIRKEKGVSVVELSTITGIPAARIYKWESGKGNPKADDVRKLQDWMDGNIEQGGTSSFLKRTYGRDLKDDHIELLKASNELLKKAYDTSSRDLRQEIKDVRERQSALMEILLLIAWMPGKKTVYNKTVEILERYKFEGIVL